ncbi:hypothetical protein ACEPAH_4980 [Sanghuangporus vaninii]
MRRRAPKSQNASYIHPFINGSRFLFGVGETPRTLCELAMTRLSAELRSKPEWWKLYTDPDTRKLWYNEAINRTWRVGPDANNIEAGLAKHQIDYVFDELAGYAALRDDANGIQVSCFDRIWESECLISKLERGSLLQQLDSLRLKCHYLSKQDLLVDPFRHAYRHGKSVVRHPEQLENFADDANDSCRSVHYTALSSLVTVHSDPPHAAYQSYINGVNPVMSDLHTAFQDALGHSIKLFERVLTSLHRSNPLPQRIQGTYHYRVWDEPDPPEDSDEEAWEAHSREMRHWALYRPIEIPDIPDDGYLSDSLRFGHKVCFREDQTIQIIHRVLDMHLTGQFFLKDDGRRKVLDTPWHVEGMANEQISVCCLHFLSVDGVDDARIEFRMATTSPSDFMPHDVGATLRTWGLQSGDECNQFIGSVRLRSGLSLAFPNTYQHRIRGVRLREGCKTGRLTVLEFYLVDPDITPVISTDDVAPQQRDWILQALEELIDPRLPHEVLEKIVDMTESVFSEEESEKYRVEMVKDREAFRQLNDRQYFCLPFNVDVP